MAAPDISAEECDPTGILQWRHGRKEEEATFRFCQRATWTAGPASTRGLSERETALGEGAGAVLVSLVASVLFAVG